MHIYSLVWIYLSVVYYLGTFGQSLSSTYTTTNPLHSGIPQTTTSYYSNRQILEPSISFTSSMNTVATSSRDLPTSVSSVDEIFSTETIETVETENGSLSMSSQSDSVKYFTQDYITVSQSESVTSNIFQSEDNVDISSTFITQNQVNSDMQTDTITNALSQSESVTSNIFQSEDNGDISSTFITLNQVNTDMQTDTITNALSQSESVTSNIFQSEDNGDISSTFITQNQVNAVMQTDIITNALSPSFTSFLDSDHSSYIHNTMTITSDIPTVRSDVDTGLITESAFQTNTLVDSMFSPSSEDLNLILFSSLSVISASQDEITTVEVTSDILSDVSNTGVLIETIVTTAVITPSVTMDVISQETTTELGAVSSVTDKSVSDMPSLSIDTEHPEQTVTVTETLSTTPSHILYQTESYIPSGDTAVSVPVTPSATNTVSIQIFSSTIYPEDSRSEVTISSTIELNINQSFISSTESIQDLSSSVPLVASGSDLLQSGDVYISSISFTEPLQSTYAPHTATISTSSIESIDAILETSNISEIPTVKSTDISKMFTSDLAEIQTSMLSDHPTITPVSDGHIFSTVLSDSEAVSSMLSDGLMPTLYDSETFSILLSDGETSSAIVSDEQNLTGTIYDFQTLSTTLLDSETLILPQDTMLLDSITITNVYSSRLTTMSVLSKSQISSIHGTTVLLDQSDSSQFTTMSLDSAIYSSISDTIPFTLLSDISSFASEADTSQSQLIIDSQNSTDIAFSVVESSQTSVQSMALSGFTSSQLSWSDSSLNSSLEVIHPTADTYSPLLTGLYPFSETGSMLETIKPNVSTASSFRLASEEIRSIVSHYFTSPMESDSMSESSSDSYNFLSSDTTTDLYMTDHTFSQSVFLSTKSMPPLDISDTSSVYRSILPSPASLSSSMYASVSDSPDMKMSSGPLSPISTSQFSSSTISLYISTDYVGFDSSMTGAMYTSVDEISQMLSSVVSTSAGISETTISSLQSSPENFSTLSSASILSSLAETSINMPDLSSTLSPSFLLKSTISEISPSLLLSQTPTTSLDLSINTLLTSKQLSSLSSSVQTINTSSRIVLDDSFSSTKQMTLPISDISTISDMLSKSTAVDVTESLQIFHSTESSSISLQSPSLTSATEESVYEMSSSISETISAISPTNSILFSSSFPSSFESAQGEDSSTVVLSSLGTEISVTPEPVLPQSSLTLTDNITATPVSYLSSSELILSSVVLSTETISNYSYISSFPLSSFTSMMSADASESSITETSALSLMLSSVTPITGSAAPITTFFIFNESITVSSGLFSDLSTIFSVLNTSSTISSLVTYTVNVTSTLTSATTEVMTTSILPVPTTEPPSQTTDNITASDENFWVKTVLVVRLSFNISDPTFRTSIEERMAQAYDEAFRRESLIEQGLFEKRRRRRYTTVGDAAVHIHDVTRIGETTSVNVVYAVEKAGTRLTPENAASSLNVLGTQELAIILQQVVATVAEPYQSSGKPIDTGSDGIPLWLIATIAGAVGGLIILVWLMVCIYIKCCREKKEMEKQTEPELTSIQQNDVIREAQPQSVENSNGAGTSSRYNLPRQISKASLAKKSFAYQIKQGDEEALIDRLPETDLDVVAYENKAVTPTVPDDVKRSPVRRSPQRQEGTGSNVSLAFKNDLEPPTSSNKKGKKSSSRHNSVDPGNVVSEHPDIVETLSKPRLHKYQVLQSSFSDQDNEDLRERIRLEKQKNKDRIRSKKRKHRPKVNQPASLLYNSMGMPSTPLPSVQVESGSPVREDTHLNALVNKDGTLSSEQVSGDESLEMARSRMHRLLDDAFSLISPRASFVEQYPRFDENTPNASDEGVTATTHKRHESTDEGLDVKHEPMYINPTHSQSPYLETWSPYRASDLVAMISMPSKPEPTRLGQKPKSATRPHSSKPNRRPAASFDFTETKSASAFEDDRYTTNPGKPIVIRTRDSSNERSGTSHKQLNNRSHNGRATVMVNPLPKDNSNEQYEMNSLKGSRNSSAAKHRTAGLGRKNTDEVDVINSLDGNPNSDKFIQSLRDELGELKDMYNVSTTQRKKNKKHTPSSMTEIV